ncbi:unnamed protein product [Closterium sp. NIES-65]|nr:unnamed protein product [Closterium sp. NIES-65]
MSGNRASTDKGFILWSRELLYMAREDGGVGVKDPEITLTCLTARRIGLLLTETNELKREIMLEAAEMPLGLDTFVSHVKLLKSWSGKSERWKLACGDFMQSPLAVTTLELSREEIERERLVFNRQILLNGTTPRTPVVENGQVAALRELKGSWQRQKHQSAKCELWADRWAGLIDWKNVIKIRDSLVTPNRPRDVLLRIHSLNLQVGERLSFLSGKLVCPHCGEFESLEHCLFTCPRIQLVVGAVKRAMRMLNPGRQVADLGDLLFGKVESTSAFPEASLAAIAVHQIWAERCDCVFRERRFRARRVLTRIEAAFRLHVKVYTRAMGRRVVRKDKGVPMRWQNRRTNSLDVSGARR